MDSFALSHLTKRMRSAWAIKILDLFRGLRLARRSLVICEASKETDHGYAVEEFECSEPLTTF